MPSAWRRCRARPFSPPATTVNPRDRLRSARWRRPRRCARRRRRPTFNGAFVAGPIDHAELSAEIAFHEELVLVTARRWTSLAALRAGTAQSGPTALVFRSGCTYRQRLEQVFNELGWPSAARFEFRP